MFSIIASLGNNIMQFILKFINLGIKMLFIGFLIFSFILLFNLFQTVLNISYSQSVLAEIQAVVQIWLPFDLGSMFNWLLSASSLLIMYYLHQIGMNLVSNMVRD